MRVPWAAHSTHSENVSIVPFGRSLCPMTPTPQTVRVLLVDDEVAFLEALCEALRDAGFEVTAFADPAAALDALRGGGFDLLLSDLTMTGTDGIQLLRQASQIDPDLIGIIMTGQGSIPEAVEAMRLGAFDFVEKPFRMREIRPLLDRAVGVRRLRAENARLKAERVLLIADPDPFTPNEQQGSRSTRPGGGR